MIVPIHNPPMTVIAKELYSASVRSGIMPKIVVKDASMTGRTRLNVLLLPHDAGRRVPLPEDG